MKALLKPRLIALIASWALVIALVVVLGALYAKLSCMDEVLARANGDTIVSLELAFSGKRAGAVIDGWASIGATDTARRSIHWDWAFILAYLALMGTVSALILNAKYTPPPQEWFVWPLVLLPYVVAFLDGVENLGIYYLLSASSHGVLFTLVALLVGLFAAAKFVLLFAYVVLVVQSRQVNLQVLSLVRFSLLVLVVGVALIFVDQGEEALLAVAESSDHDLAFWLALASLVTALATWYSSRVMFMLRIPDRDELSSPEAAPFLKRWLPRVLGWMLFLVIGIGLFKATGWRWTSVFWWLLAALAIYTAVVLLRRKFLGIEDVEGSIGASDGWLRLPWQTLVVLELLLGLSVLVFIAILSDPLVTQGMGGAAVVLFSVGFMVPMGTWLVYWGARYRVPILFILFALTALLSFYNDNHWIRLSADASSTDGDQVYPAPEPAGTEAQGLKGLVEAWARNRAASTPNGGDIPLFIASAEGGGIRAAYWTAQVLAALQDESEQFADHLFAISGVSGGSLGGAVFAAQVASGTKAKSFGTQADAMLKQDFLAPTLGTLLFPDLVQRFLPWPAFEDRAVTLEQSWESAWQSSSAGNDETQRNAFEQPFSDLWGRSGPSGEKGEPPLLLLNSTSVAEGRRLIMHPLDISGRDGEFHDCSGRSGHYSDQRRKCDCRYRDVYDSDGGRKHGKR